MGPNDFFNGIADDNRYWQTMRIQKRYGNKIIGASPPSIAAPKQKNKA
jgi:hypothetical protein